MSVAQQGPSRPVYPEEVRRQPETATLRMTWSDGHIGEYPFAYLRGWCPCAECQGHGGDKRYVHAANTELGSVAIVGKYALSFRWGDGHETGIYTYRYLRELCPCESCVQRRPGADLSTNPA
jgi:DUF971 family protein